MGLDIIDSRYYALGLLVVLLVAAEFGYRMGRRLSPEDVLEGERDAGPFSGMIYALLGLLIAFTFSGATGRFDDRRDLILKEANAIGTAYLRIDLLPATYQPELRQLFRDYTQSRITAYQLIKSDTTKAEAEYRHGIALQQRLWQRSVAAAEATHSNSTQSLVIGAMNEMIDVANERFAAVYKHPPAVIYILLFVLAMLAAMLAGYKLSTYPRIPRMQTVVFALALAATMYMVLDLEQPRLGLFMLDKADMLLEETLKGMQAP